MFDALYKHIERWELGKMAEQTPFEIHDAEHGPLLESTFREVLLLMEANGDSEFIITLMGDVKINRSYWDFKRHRQWLGDQPCLTR